MWKQGETEGGEGEQEREREQWVEARRNPSKSGPILPDEVAFVGKDVEFKGVITYSGTVRIDGALDGEIHTDGGLLVGPEAVLKAKVTAGTVVCQGTIHGDIQAKDQIVLRAPAVVEGSLITPVLSMEEGVVFNGTLEMKPQAKAAGSRDEDANVVSITSRPPIQRLAA
ncbi:MAG: polymer-forming cytoskeletal protein [Nitrospira sp.]|nr:polymer-forming cytoskeletal protein [Nitrospira sp.]MDH4251844.1 polymer-forming cytoskeletal protein [Nitrospira sp.]MDH4342126.1 polymer-forming cytoskeletal protein [Nitrospira sp.]MDH5335435.1 polymer-forming cytoskeletal protein [Nitrospira sp.]